MSVTFYSIMVNNEYKQFWKKYKQYYHQKNGYSKFIQNILTYNTNSNNIYKVLEILRFLVEIQNEDYDQSKLTIPVYEWQRKDWIQFKPEIANIQNILLKSKTIKTIYEVIINPTQIIENKFQALELGIALLLGGNENVQ